jgi:hypothetical protein
MIVRLTVLGLLVVGVGVAGGGAALAETAGDRITLKDGSVVLGLVMSVTNGPRGSVEFLVRRAWAEKAIKGHLDAWDRSTAASTRLALGQRRKRLEEWRRERAPGAGPNDRIIPWIDQELGRLTAPGNPEPSILLRVRLPRNEVRGLDRRPAGVERLIRLGWLCSLAEPESMQVDDLKTALEARGYAVDAIARTPPASIDRLLPLAPEPEPRWLARRAATELAVDPNLRFIRFQDTVFPDPGAGQPLSAMGLSTALSELKRLFDLDPGQQTDPLLDKLKTVSARGRIGAAVTRLVIQPDMSSVTVESTLWVREGQQWFVFGSSTATVRPDDLGHEAGEELAQDPQVKDAFKIVELLGLGAIPADVKARSLRIGAATEKALGMARSAFNQDLDGLALPVLEPNLDDPGVRRGAPDHAPKPRDGRGAGDPGPFIRPGP